MKTVCLYFQVHQPNRLKNYSFFEIGKERFYENDELNAGILDKVSEKCYLPANQMMLELIKRFRGKFKIAFSLSGVFIEQCENHRPDVLESFKRLAETGSVEFLSETYYHSLSYLYSKEEFKEQVKKHADLIKKHFKQEPKVFRNTELIYNNELAKCVEDLGYDGILCEAREDLLSGRTPNQLYKAPNVKKLKSLMRNYKLSDDVAFRFNNTSWNEYPLTASKFASWISQDYGENINIFIDYESIGEHLWADTGIFGFWNRLPTEAVKQELIFLTPSEVINKYEANEVYDCHLPTSWADTEKDLSAWVGNEMQIESLDKIYQLEEYIKKSKNKDILHTWRKLQTSDHFYYMSTKNMADGEVHAYFSPFDSPYNGYIHYMNVISDIEIHLEEEGMELGIWG